MYDSVMSARWHRPPQRVNQGAIGLTLNSFVANGELVVPPPVSQAPSAGSVPGPVDAPQKLFLAFKAAPVSLSRPQFELPGELPNMLFWLTVATTPLLNSMPTP